MANELTKVVPHLMLPSTNLILQHLVEWFAPLYRILGVALDAKSKVTKSRIVCLEVDALALNDDPWYGWSEGQIGLGRRCAS
ncbi:hypothetical protein F751_0895 [Auxenochlorella protothecoides]|uniref:Uncharacterized protein n=1 Tax=Auxenochlorella protothecoides TaxID=3075 RepID=A0A087SI03_AUXPR|nr:hypothetical protein F751_0895 [Auxenochlorella protothecoides]KFM25357.1 hypothetical protein F751_0895 [Auxenochlorella protothecoides]